MAHAAPNLVRFLSRLHRRFFVVRLAEHAGVGLVIAAGVSVLLLPVLLLRAKPALPVLAVLLSVGAMTGAAWLLFRRPRLIDTAGEADRQLGLADLLATAWMVARDERPPDDPFERAVLALADARAAGLSPSSVVLNRFGARAWTGIGLSTALAITLAMLSANPVVTRAGAEPAGGGRRTAAARPGEKREITTAGDAGSRPARIVADHPNLEEDGFNPARRTTSAAGDSGDSSVQSETADPSGSGGGVGTSRAQSDTGRSGATASAADAPQRGTTPGSGGGSPSNQRGRGTGESGLSAGAQSGARSAAAPPWASSSWDARRIEAGNAVRSGVVPPRYHDLVRAYFGRDDSER